MFIHFHSCQVSNPTSEVITDNSNLMQTSGEIDTNDKIAEKPANDVGNSR